MRDDEADLLISPPIIHMQKHQRVGVGVTNTHTSHTRPLFGLDLTDCAEDSVLMANPNANHSDWNSRLAMSRFYVTFQTEKPSVFVGRSPQPHFFMKSMRHRRRRQGHRAAGATDCLLCTQLASLICPDRLHVSNIL